MGLPKIKDQAEFDIIGTVQRAFEGEKSTRLALKCETGARVRYIDVVQFGHCQAVKGDRVRVTGEIGSEKSGLTRTNPRTGKTYDKWVPILWGKHCEILSMSQGTLDVPANDNYDQDIPRGRDRRGPAPQPLATGTDDDDIPF